MAIDQTIINLINNNPIWIFILAFFIGVWISIGIGKLISFLFKSLGKLFRKETVPVKRTIQLQNQNYPPQRKGGSYPHKNQPLFHHPPSFANTQLNNRRNKWTYKNTQKQQEVF